MERKGAVRGGISYWVCWAWKLKGGILCICIYSYEFIFFTYISIIFMALGGFDSVHPRNNDLGVIENEL